MNCDCGHELKETTESVRYEEGGLPHVHVEMTVRRCAACGEEEHAIHGIEALHRALAGVLVKKTHRLTGEEFRFLRKALGWSGEMTAARLGVTPSQLSRWENNKDPVGPIADRLLRALVVIESPVTDYSSETLAKVDDEIAPAEVRMRRASNRWRADDIAA